MSVSHRVPKQIEETLVTNRRGFLRSAGMLAVSFGVFGGASVERAEAQTTAATQGPGPYPNPDFRQIDSWIVIHQDNSATFYVGKTDPGQGTGTGFRQLMSDELDIAFERTTCIMGARTLPSTRSGRAGRPPWRGIRGRCAGWPRRRAAFCSKWHPRGWGCRSINSPFKTEW